MTKKTYGIEEYHNGTQVSGHPGNIGIVGEQVAIGVMLNNVQHLLCNGNGRLVSLSFNSAMVERGDDIIRFNVVERNNMAKTLKQESQYWVGYNAYCGNLPYAACETDEHRKGWRAAQYGEQASGYMEADNETAHAIALAKTLKIRTMVMLDMEYENTLAEIADERLRAQGGW